jgi:hypothetical protein
LPTISAEAPIAGPIHRGHGGGDAACRIGALEELRQDELPYRHEANEEHGGDGELNGKAGEVGCHHQAEARKTIAINAVEQDDASHRHVLGAEHGGDLGGSAAERVDGEGDHREKNEVADDGRPLGGEETRKAPLMEKT